MFKYFALLFDYLLALSYSLATGQLHILTMLPPILHTLAFWVSPHCHASHCRPRVKSG